MFELQKQSGNSWRRVAFFKDIEEAKNYITLMKEKYKHQVYRLVQIIEER